MAKYRKRRSVVSVAEMFGIVQPSHRNKTGYRGIFVHEDGYYYVRVMRRHRRYYLGRYRRLEDAVAERDAFLRWHDKKHAEIPWSEFIQWHYLGKWRTEYRKYRPKVIDHRKLAYRSAA